MDQDVLQCSFPTGIADMKEATYNDGCGMSEFADKIVLVTGSSSGLGKGMARLLCHQGAKVVINGRHPQRMQDTLHHFRKAGYEPEGIIADVSDPDDSKKMIEKCIEVFGRLDILINNAGIGCAGLFEETSTECFQQIIQTNLLGSLFPTRFAIPHIKESHGSILFISSLAGLFGLPYISVYSPSKMALTAVAQMLRLELDPASVHIGIAYVGFLINDPEKKVLGPDGQWLPPGDRPRQFSQSIEKASAIIIKALKKRKKTIYLSPYGKLIQVLTRVFPGVYRWFLVRHRNRIRTTYVSKNKQV